MHSFARLGQVVDDTALTFCPRDSGPVPLSVLDLAPVPDGGTAAQALHATIDLARHAERLGYRRSPRAEEHTTARHSPCTPARRLRLDTHTATPLPGGPPRGDPSHPPLHVVCGPVAH